MNTKELVMEFWNKGFSLDNIVTTLKSNGKTFRNGKDLSKTYVKGMIQNLIKRDELKKRAVIVKKDQL